MLSSILVVEDSPSVRNLLILILRQGGFSVVSATDGLDALEKLETEEVELIITDVNMPRMDGFTLISTVRANSKVQGMPIIILSTEKGPHDRAEGLARGANLYLNKPVSPDELLAAVQELLPSKASGYGQPQP